MIDRWIAECYSGRFTGMIKHPRGEYVRISDVPSLSVPQDILDALSEAEEYFENRADADYDQDGFVPNEEMKLLKTLRDAIAKASENE